LAGCSRQFVVSLIYYPTFQRFCFDNNIISINRPGGTGRITKIHYSSNNANGILVDSLDVKYTVSGGFDQHLDPDLVTPHQDAPRGRRIRRPVAAKQPAAAEAENQTNNNNNNITNNSNARSRSRSKRNKPKAKKKRTPTKAAPPAALYHPQQQQQSSLKPPPSTTSAVKKQFGRLTAVLSPNNNNNNNTNNKVASSRRQQPPFFSPETANVQNHRRRAIPADVPSEVILYANGQSGSPESHISMGPSFVAPAIRNPFHPDVSMLDDDDDDRKLSPTSARLMEARTMAAATTVGNKTSPSELERIIAHGAATRRNNTTTTTAVDLDESMEDDSCQEGAILAVAEKPRGHLTLREVFDDGYKKASKFIGDVVLSSSSGHIHTESVAAQEAPPADEPMDDGDHHNNDGDDDEQQSQQRLHQFRTLLHEVLLNSEGMMEETAVAAELSPDYTEPEVGRYLTQLAAQNKIMQTDGWIYNI